MSESAVYAVYKDRSVRIRKPKRWQGFPLQGYHLALLMSFPYAGGVVAAVISGKHFKQ